MGHIDGDDGVAVQRDHHAETSGGDQVDGGHAEARRQNAVEGRRCTRRAECAPARSPALPSLNLARWPCRSGCRPNPCARFSFNSGGSFMPSATTTMVKKLASLFALRNVAAHMPNRKRNLRDENYMRAAGDSGVKRDPAAIAAHHLDHHHAMMRFRSGVNLVDGVGYGVQGGIKAERDLGGGKIVVDRLRHADDLHSLLRKFVADLLRSIAADGNDRVDAELGGVGDHLG